MKTSDKDIRRLVEKFMDGDTTLVAEHELYAYFRGNTVARDLEPMRELFLGLESLDGLGKQQKSEKQYKPALRHIRFRPWQTAVAATLLTLFVVSAALYVNHRQNYHDVLMTDNNK